MLGDRNRAGRADQQLRAVGGHTVPLRVRNHAAVFIVIPIGQRLHLQGVGVVAGHLRVAPVLSVRAELPLIAQARSAGFHRERNRRVFRRVRIRRLRGNRQSAVDGGNGLCFRNQFFVLRHRQTGALLQHVHGHITCDLTAADRIVGIGNRSVHIALDGADRLSIHGSDHRNPFGAVQENQIPGLGRIAAGLIGAAKSLLHRGGVGSGGEAFHFRIVGAEAYKQGVPVGIGGAVPVAVTGIALLLAIAVHHKILFAFLIAELRLGNGNQILGKIAGQLYAAGRGSPIGLRCRFGHGQFGLSECRMAVCIADRHLHGIASAALGHDDKLFRFRNAQRIAFDFLRAAEHDHLSLVRRKASGHAQLKAHRLCSGYCITHIRPELNGKLFHFFGLFRRFRLFRRFGFFR